MNKSTSHIIIKPVAIATTLLMLPLTGCMTPGQAATEALKNCDKAKQKGQEKIEDHFDDARKCCLKLLPDSPAEYLECQKAVNDAKADADKGLNDAEIACIAANFTALEQQIKFIFDTLEGVIDLACAPLDRFRGIVQSERGEVRNVSSPLPVADGVLVKTMGSVIHEVEGSGRFVTSQRGRIQILNAFDSDVMNGSVELLIDAEMPRARRDGAVHRLEISIEGMGRLVLDPDLPARIAGVDGSMRIEAGVHGGDTESPSSFVISLPLNVQDGTASIRTNGWVDPDEIMPVAPNAVADWYRDFSVDEHDYAAFLADFSTAPIDLDGDGISNDADVAYFEERWIEAMEG